MVTIARRICFMSSSGIGLTAIAAFISPRFQNVASGLFLIFVGLQTICLSGICIRCLWKCRRCLWNHL